ncbi:MAG TPA: phage tail sheath subtilisin-like domain-containing protein [Verrucomicrobiota bacterium]|nr:phage tail sheath family protein [Verrucomicrobiales bacterium]HRI15303.1 phage tail sheath subtilisin-like domain-containing protein [Verrucomicrobiota bacterium]
MPPKTPGVYVQEISTLPPSVAAVSTAIPAFIGYTATPDPADATKAAWLNAPRRIETLMEYEQLFGGPPDVISSVSVAADDSVAVAAESTFPLLYYSLRLYFENGGGPCYIVSIGLHSAQPALQNFTDALNALQKMDEPTLIVMPDAVRLDDDYKTACGAALDHCGGVMKDRFAILDVKQLSDKTADEIAKFRELSSDYLAYGAAYAPYLRTSLAFAYAEEKVPVRWAFNGLRISGPKVAGKVPKVKFVPGTEAGKISFAIDATGPFLTVTMDKPGGSSAADIAAAWDTWAKDPANKAQGFSVAAATTPAPTTPVPPMTEPANLWASDLKSLKAVNTAKYNAIKSALATKRATLPPSGAIAGIFARVDRDRGVWKAPANVAVASVLDLDRIYTDLQQEGLNVDPVGGRSINVIRSFTGRGTLVWGARTLAGNDNEWRYVSVRRLFIMIEESAQKSTAFAVFEPNDATTWLKVKAMIESFLYGLWEQGALAGSKPEAAYFVNVGLGTTMTPQDILEGRMIVEIGIAAVRPAEFIILRFSHKMQQA